MMKPTKNVRLLYVHSILSNITSFVVTGGILQTFLLEYGLEAGQISVAVALFQVAQSVSMLVFSARLERVKGLLRLNQWLLFTTLPLMIAMGAITLNGGIPGEAFPVFLITGILTFGGMGLISSLMYKIPYVLIDMKDYGHMTGIQGALSGLLCMGLAALLPVLLNRFAYVQIAPFLPVAGILSVVLTWFVLAGMKAEHVPPKIYGTRIDLLRYKPFVKTIIPNLARGFGSGLLGFITTIGYRAGFVNDMTASVMVFISYAMAMLGCYLFSRITGKIRDRKILLVCGCVIAVMMPLLMTGTQSWFFLAKFTLVQFFLQVLAVAIPSSLAGILDYEAVMQCTSWRLALTMASGSLAVVAAVPMTEAIGYIPTFLIGGAMFLISSIGYYLVDRDVERETNDQMKQPEERAEKRKEKGELP